MQTNKLSSPPRSLLGPLSDYLPADAAVSAPHSIITPLAVIDNSALITAIAVVVVEEVEVEVEVGDGDGDGVESLPK